MLQIDNLEAALSEVVSGDVTDGAPNPSVVALRERGRAGLDELSHEVRGGTYLPRPLALVEIPKADGSTRRLAIPAARDRVLERALLQVIGDPLDALLGPWSFAYRRGVGVGDAVRAVVRTRDEGFGWVVHTDIDDCFENVDRDRLVRMLGQLLPDDSVMPLIQAWLERPVRAKGGALRWPKRGVPQGSPLSPLWANLLLARVDETLAEHGCPVVRFADDLLVFARDRESAMQALRTTQKAATDAGFQIGDDKTEVIDFDTGFCFLGEDFNGRYPAATGEPLDEPDRNVLYVGVQGAYVSLAAGRLVVSRKRAELLSVPSGHVARVVVFGSVTLSPAVVGWALSTGVGVVFCSRRGGLLGVAAPAGGPGVELRRRQFVRSDDPTFSLAVSQGLVRGKLHNQRVLLQRRITPEAADALRQPIVQLAGCIALLPTATSLAELMGVEGAAARAYFEGLRGVVPNEFGFDARVTRPPGDVVNAALSYGYAILVGECATALAAAGLDPSVGFLHADRGSRLSLALDLAEEFRPLIVDSVVVSMARGGELSTASGRPVQAGKGVLLTEAGRRSLVAAIERRLLTRVHHLASGYKTSYRRSIFLQAQGLVAAVRTGEQCYEPMLWRV